MFRRDVLMGSAALMSMAGCATSSKFKRYDGPEVTFVVVNKSDLLPEGQGRHLAHL